MNALLLSDLHLTDRPEDEYRWSVFEQARELAEQYGLSDLLILGDLTEHKDYHSSTLVNRLVDSLARLRKSRVNEIHVLRGNHDGIDNATAFFGFLNHLPWCHFYAQPAYVQRGRERWLMLPHTREPERDWAGIEFEATHIFLHGTVCGAISESGKALLGGIPVDWFDGLRAQIYAGDVHVPQHIGPVEYVGAPYHIRFGDSFAGRAIALVKDDAIECPLENIRKVTLWLDRAMALDTVEMGNLVRPGDQIRFIVTLADSEMGDWQERKKQCVDFCVSRGLHLAKVELARKQAAPLGKPKIQIKTRTPAQSFEAFVRANSVDDSVASVGRALLKEQHE